MGKTNVWFRLGVSVDLTQDEILNLLNGDTDIIKKMFLDGRVIIRGDSYIPDCIVDDLCGKLKIDADYGDVDLDTGSIDGYTINIVDNGVDEEQ